MNRSCLLSFVPSAGSLRLCPRTFALLPSSPRLLLTTIATTRAAPVKALASPSAAHRLRELSVRTRRGDVADAQTVAAVQSVVAELEADPFPTVSSSTGGTVLTSAAGQRLLDGAWELVFQLPSGSGPGDVQRTSVAAADRVRGGRVLQTIDVAQGRLENCAELPGWLRFRVDARFAVLPEGEVVEVVFEKAGLRLGSLPELGIPIAWLGGRGTLETTHLSEDVRIGRGDKGTLFCLVRPGAGLQ